MPQIPVYQQRTVPRGTLSIPQQPDIGRDLMIAGAQIQQATNAWARKLDADAAAWAGAELARAQSDWDRQFIERQQNVQAGAPDFTKGLVEDFRTYRKETEGRAPTETAKAYLSQRFDALESQLMGASIKFEAEEGLRNRVRLNSQANDAARLAVRSRPEKFSELLAERRAALDASNLTPEDRDRLYDEAQQGLAADALVGMAKADPEGVMLALYAEPGKSGNAAVEALTPEGRDQMMRFVQGQFESLVRAQEAQERMAEAERKRLHDENERVFTSAFLNGRLSKGDLARAVDADAIDAGLARTLANEIEAEATGGAASTTNDAMLFAVNANLLAMTPEDIRQMPGISWRDKVGLLEKLEQRQSGWPSTPEAREAMARIDRELGFVPGSMNTVDPNEMRRRGRALTEFYNRVQALDPAQRESAVIGISEAVIEDVLRDQRQKKADQARRRLEYLRQQDVEGMGATDRAAHDREVQAQEAIIREAGK